MTQMYASIGSPGAKTLTSFARRRCSTTKRRRGLAAEPILPGEAPLRVGELEPEASALLKPQPKPRVAAILEVCSLHCALPVGGAGSQAPQILGINKPTWYCRAQIFSRMSHFPKQGQSPQMFSHRKERVLSRESENLSSHPALPTSP